MPNSIIVPPITLPPRVIQPIGASYRVNDAGSSSPYFTISQSAGGLTQLSPSNRIYDVIPSQYGVPYVPDPSGDWYFLVPFYAGYTINIFGVASDFGTPAPVDIFWGSEVLANDASGYQPMLRQIVGSFSATDVAVLNQGDKIRFLALSTTADALLLTVRVSIFLTSL